MSKAIHAREFYVVGGPVQPDRSCYVERTADAELEEAIRARRLCCVLGARGIGKSSLMHRIVRKLKDSRELAVVVDLVQLGVLAERGADRGWALAFAERVVRELGIKTDLGGWWRASELEEPERLVEFFWRIVLTNTTAPITVFVDGLGAAADPSLVPELLAVVEGCYGRRSADPDFGRLTFVLVGSASRRALAGNERSSPFATAALIELADFSATESYTLALGFEGEPELAQALMDRVHGWTGGHPYLTQKVARGVLRKGGKLEDVERVVREQVLAPGAAESDPFLNHVRLWLTAKAPGARRAARLLRKLAQGRKVSAPPDPLVLERLQLSGVVGVDGSRRLEFRNRIFKELVGRWSKGAGRGWRIAAAAAVVLLLAAGAGYWYVQYLPTADIATLESATARPADVDAAYGRLRALPGFAERADRLFAAALERRSRAATTLVDATAADARLRALPEQDTAADRLLTEFWLRRTATAMQAEQRDAALLYALRAAAVPGASDAAHGEAAELVDGDYSLLERTLRIGSAPSAWHMQFAESSLLTLSPEYELQQIPFGAAASGDTTATPPVRLTALQHTALTRELAVDGDGTAGAFELHLVLQHPAPEELLATLTAPSGAQATVTVPSNDGVADASLVFAARRGMPLAALADEGRQGTWRLTLVDRRAGQSGALAGWTLRFGDDAWTDEPAEPLPIPDPTRTDAVSVARVGAWALVQPRSPGAIGTVSLWNLATGDIAADIALPAAPQHVAIDAAGRRLIATAGKVATVWNTADGALVARLATDSEFVLPPVFSVDGGYFAIAERVDEGPPLYSVLRASDASLVGSFSGVQGARRWWLGPGGRYLALDEPANVVRVLGRRGETLASLQHARDVARVVPLPAGTTLLTIDGAGTIAAWPLGRDLAPAPRLLGVATSPADVSVAADGARLAYVTRDAAVVVVDVATGAEIARLRQAGPLPVTVQLADDGRKLVSADGSRLRLWTLPDGAADAARRATDVAMPVALDPTMDVVAIGTPAGGVRIGTAEALAARDGSSPSLDYFGHRSAVTAVVIAAEHGVAVTGAADGTVRVWDVTGLAPPTVLSSPLTASVSLLALSADARLLAIAAGATVRVVATADGSVVSERTTATPVTALAFAADGGAVAIGDTAGDLLVTPFVAARASFNVKLEAAVSAIAFAPNGERLAVADRGGALQLLHAGDGTPIGSQQRLLESVGWLGFDSAGDTLLTATADWLHAWRVATGLEPVRSRFAPRSLAAAGLAVGDGLAVRVAEPDAGGRLAVATLDLEAPPAAANPPARDWPSVLGLRLGADGAPAELDR
jgi:WD40 repeat protein/subtilisin-like proprotein convertase family protein